MKIILAALAAYFSLFSSVFSQVKEGGEAALPRVGEEHSEVGKADPIDFEEGDLTTVSVLGYHDFSETDRETAMRIRTSKFRDQMQKLKDEELPVISMQDFISWKKGEKKIPEKSVVITIDDGWKSVYTEAFPILKEFGYPFTLYLYKNYIDGGGKALTTPMIKEMLKNGANLGSHSISHPAPRTVRNFERRGGEAYSEFLEKEMGSSRKFLKRKFKQDVTTYAFPGGFFTDQMVESSEDFGYSHLFTVQPGKVRTTSPDQTLPRYIVLGNYDKIFDYAIQFTKPGDLTSGEAEPVVIKNMEFPVSPEAGSIINTRLPVIRVNFSTAEAVDPSTLEMRIAGFGKVPATYSQDTKIYSWKLNRRLRQKICKVEVKWKELGADNETQTMDWQFQVDRGAAYLQPE